jgi:hypothetical protein
MKLWGLGLEEAKIRNRKWNKCKRQENSKPDKAHLLNVSKVGFKDYTNLKQWYY